MKWSISSLLALGSLVLAFCIVAVLPCPKGAHAQGCVCVTDAPVELNTGIIATSVTAQAAFNNFQSQAQYLASLMRIMSMDDGIADAEAFVTTYPGWKDPGPNAADIAANITNRTLASYANAIAIAKSQAADFPAEDAQFKSLATANAAATGVLQAMQVGNMINLAAAQQTQLLRQLEVTHIMVDAVRAGEELNEKAGAGAESEVSQLTAAQH